MHASAELDGTVFLVAQAHGEGPDFHISGEEVVARGPDYDPWFSSSLEIGVGAGTIDYVDDWYWYITVLSEISHARLSSIGAAVRCHAYREEWPARIYIHNGESAFSEYLENFDPRTYLEVDDSTIYAIVTERYAERPPRSRGEYREMLASIAARYECRVVKVLYLDPDERIEIDENSDFYDDMPHFVNTCIESIDPDVPARRLIECGRAVHDYLAAIRSGEFGAKTIVELLRAGHVDLLVGQVESSFLEVKSMLYNLDVGPSKTAKDRHKIELAQDVARFANGETDAVLAIGYKEAKVGERTEISSVAPIKLARFNAAQYQAVLDERIVPPLVGLVVEQVEIGDGVGIAFIFVPRQPEEMQPYLVHGAIIGGGVEGKFFSIVQRRGEGSINITAAQIHTYITAGRAFLRQQQRGAE
ncbi:hypothetical protein [Mycolicibacter virginiensis]|uniref:hypothetical protein n=1 Tax=Mycolicibacter virginiensis TaxID=1795032 RepID=UPI001057414F|nr:hypothetical protein [Mycolicibacter virginiensis]